MGFGKTARVAAVMGVAAFVVTAIDLRPAAAGSADNAKSAGIGTASGDEFSARKRHRRYYSHRGNAGAAQAFGAIAGTIGGIIAADQARRYYRRQYWADPYYAAPYGPYGGPYYGSYGYDPY